MDAPQRRTAAFGRMETEKAMKEYSAQVVQVGGQSRGVNFALQFDVAARCVPHGHGDEQSVLSVAHIGKHLQLQIFKFDDISLMV